MSIKAISTMTNSMGKEKKCCMIIVYTKEIFIEVKDKAKESSHGLTEVIMRVNFAIIRQKEGENTCGQMEEHMKVSGRMARWMGTES